MPLVTTSDGISISYEVRGNGPPLLLVMGLGADGSVWEKHVKEYEQHFSCVLIDNRGVGKSDKPDGPYTTKRMAQDILEVADELNLESAHAAGISMGGAIVQEMALLAPEKVRSAVIISSWARLNPYATRVFENFKSARASMRPEDFMETLQLWIFAAPYFERESEALAQDRQDAAGNANPQPQAAFDAQCDACISHDAESRLGNIACPTLVVAGKDDIFTPLEFSLTIAEGIPGAKLLAIPDTGHAVHWEALETFNASSRDFMLATED